jgi:tryptophan 2,3-dioxygenase
MTSNTENRPSINPNDFSYGDYLHVPELLALQDCLSVDPKTGKAEHDETLFIIIHQVSELWFKQLLHEMDFVVALLDDDQINGAQNHLKRVLKILKTLVGQVDVLETMTPAEFASFRAFLANASGFQSAQFREIEFVLSIKDRVQLDWFEGADGERLRERYDAPTLWDAFVKTMARAGADVPAEVLNRDVREPVVENAALQALIIERYDDEGFAGLCETLTDLDEGLQEWRYRHVMMVRRTIGTKMGTGGSDGAAYLASTLFRPAFPDLWSIRTAF